MFMLVTRFPFLMIFGFESGCMGLENQVMAREILEISTFAEVGLLMIPGAIFYDFGWPRDQF